MFDVNSIIEAGGLLLIAAIIFAESGMFIGFFFPGDTLLMAAGIFAAQGQLNIVTVILTIIVAAFCGDNVGYYIGRKHGRKLFKKKDGVIFRQEYVQRAENFYEKHGDKMMLFAHFVPIVRTFAPPVAGVAKMNYKKYVAFDTVGIVGWATSVTLVGYFFGQQIPHIDSYIMLAVIGVMIFTLGPTFYHIIKALIENKRNKPKQED